MGKKVFISLIAGAGTAALIAQPANSFIMNFLIYLCSMTLADMVFCYEVAVKRVHRAFFNMFCREKARQMMILKAQLTAEEYARQSQVALAQAIPEKSILSGRSMVAFVMSLAMVVMHKSLFALLGAYVFTQ